MCKGISAVWSQHFQGQSFAGAVLREGRGFGVAELIAEEEHLSNVEDSHLDGDAAGVQRALLRPAEQYNVGKGRAGESS